MTSDDELRRLFHADASTALEAGGVQALISEGIDRRRKRRQTSAVVGVTLTVAGLAVGANAVGSGGHRAATRPPVNLATPGAVLTTPPVVPSPVITPSSHPPGQTSQDARTKWFAVHKEDYVPQMEHLAALWGLSGDADFYLVKSEAGTLLLDDKPVPDTSPIAAAQAKFHEAGYGQAEIEFLSNLWEETDPTIVTTVAGQQLLDHKTLPTD